MIEWNGSNLYFQEFSSHSHKVEICKTIPVENFVAPDFWTDLSGAVAGLKQVLEYPDAFEDEGEAVHEEELNHTELIVDDSVRSSDAHRLLFEKENPTDTGPDLSPALKNYLLDRSVDDYIFYIVTGIRGVPYMEVRRRLWQCIGVLDLQSAFDRGSQPMIGFHDLQSLPLDINDQELSLQSKLPPDLATQSRWTDMSLNVIIYRAGICRRHIIAIGSSSASSSGDGMNARSSQLATLAKFEGEVQQLSAVCSSPPSNIQKFAMAVAQESLVAMRLLLHRPLHRSSSIPIDNALPGEQIDILQTATEVLERSQMKRTQLEFAPWAWFQWVKWYALAVVLAELCAAPKGPQADRAWKVAQLSFDDYAKDVADSRNGLLWKPIQRLMRRARQARTPGPVSLQAMTTEHLSKGHEDVNMKDFRTVPDHENWLVDNVTGLENVSLAKDHNDIPFDQFQTVDDSWLQWDLLLNDFEDPNLFDA
ncbi:hypothetical protein PRZ48_007745 [Zasmidium cellare]|uniref:Transcription factor domain-containing protein n=1 Tax=Zasmidium cellare TaxID=395010 RepID=A0ABR0EK89_ZASCE|nr:hypothetical protein PRZ48_007745 [Zasmidium cellare]